ncbi:hypothetical protein DXG01_008978 [Tephrocybe rancida]|nr:hypothetical protein DXG01_008978 [Tephrocybe rancida]
MAMLIQTFGHDLALPYLKRFQAHCLVEGMKAPSPPAAGRPLTPHGSTVIPPALPKNGVLVRCRCRPGRPVDLTKDFAIADMTALPPPRAVRTVVVSSTDGSDNENPLIPQIRAKPGWESTVEDGFLGTIVSIGPQTDAVIDHFSFLAQEIPKLRVLTQRNQSSCWEVLMRVGEFRYSYEQAATMFEALKADLGVDRLKASEPPL